MFALGKHLNLGQPINWSNPLNRGLVSRYKALNCWNTGNRFMDLAAKNHGTLTNGAAWASAAGSGSIYFDGTDDEVTFSSVPGGERYPPAGAGTYTAVVAFWWKPYAWPPIAAESAFPVQLHDPLDDSHYPWTDGLLYVSTFRDTRVEGITSLFPDTSWRRVLVYHNPVANQWILYENGRQTHSTTSLGYIDLGTTFRFGRGGPGAYFARGKLDDVCFWFNPSLSAAGMALADYQATRQQYDPTLNWIESRAMAPAAAVGADGFPILYDYGSEPATQIWNWVGVY